MRLDARAMKILAHPLRSRLLGALRLGGPASASTLAQALGTNSGATSYHLRRLAETGLVVDQPGGRGRERLWRAASERHSWSPSDAAGDPDGEAANDWLEADSLRTFEERAGSWQDAKHRWPPQWRDAAGGGDWFVDLPPDRLRALLDDLTAVIEDYRDAPPAPDARRVLLFVHAFPQGDPP